MALAHLHGGNEGEQLDGAQMSTLRSEAFDFGLDDVTVPQGPRSIDAHRLLVYDRASGHIDDASMRTLGNHLAPGDLLVFNDSRVIPVQLYRDDGTFILLIEPAHPSLTNVRMICPFKPRVGETIQFPYASILLTEHEPGWDVYRGDITAFDPIVDLGDFVRQHGQFPLPIYLKRQPTPADSLALQSVYARIDGSIAPPVAGSHFDDALIRRLAEQGIKTATITLHVGYGTFRSFKTTYIDDHVMDPEYFNISRETIAEVAETIERGHRVVAVGTTSARALETVGMHWSDAKRSASDQTGETRLFIKPPYTPRLVRGLITNFQYPRLPVIAMAATFVGLQELRDVYAHAYRNDYMFYSYGDAMLLKF
jgi:S-adenosylmethionine:tRNA ribosyltransferase-isomerase